jgi:hypothetical protein
MANKNNTLLRTTFCDVIRHNINNLRKTHFDVLVKLLLVEVIHDRIFKIVFIFLTKSSVVRQKREIREYVLHNDEKNNTMIVFQINEVNLAFKISLPFFNILN